MADGPLEQDTVAAKGEDVPLDYDDNYSNNDDGSIGSASDVASDNESALKSSPDPPVAPTTAQIGQKATADVSIDKSSTQLQQTAQQSATDAQHVPGGVPKQPVRDFAGQLRQLYAPASGETSAGGPVLSPPPVGDSASAGVVGGRGTGHFDRVGRSTEPVADYRSGGGYDYRRDYRSRSRERVHLMGGAGPPPAHAHNNGAPPPPAGSYGQGYPYGYGHGFVDVREMRDVRGGGVTRVADYRQVQPQTQPQAQGQGGNGPSGPAHASYGAPYPPYGSNGSYPPAYGRPSFPGPGPGPGPQAQEGQQAVLRGPGTQEPPVGGDGRQRGHDRPRPSSEARGKEKDRRGGGIEAGRAGGGGSKAGSADAGAGDPLAYPILRALRKGKATASGYEAWHGGIKAAVRHTLQKYYVPAGPSPSGQAATSATSAAAAASSSAPAAESKRGDRIYSTEDFKRLGKKLVQRAADKLVLKWYSSLSPSRGSGRQEGSGPGAGPGAGAEGGSGKGEGAGLGAEGSPQAESFTTCPPWSEEREGVYVKELVKRYMGERKAAHDARLELARSAASTSSKGR